MDFNPQFFHTIDDGLQLHRSSLQFCLGKTFNGIWAAYDEENERFQELPLILRITQHHLELCASHLDRFSITQNTIDVNQAFEIDFGTHTRLYTWKLNPFPELVDSIGQKITKIAFLEYELKTRQVSPEDSPEYQAVWLLTGLEFILETTQFSVLNGLDCNRVHSGTLLADHFRKTPV